MEDLDGRINVLYPDFGVLFFTNESLCPGVHDGVRDFHHHQPYRSLLFCRLRLEDSLRNKWNFKTTYSNTRVRVRVCIYVCVRRSFQASL